MDPAFIAGLCVLAVAVALFRGGGGRLVLLAAIAVGVLVGFAGDAVTTGIDFLATAADFVARLGGSL